MTDAPLREALRDHMTTVWGDIVASAIVTRFVAVVEVADRDGDPGIIMLRSDDTPPWVVAGLIRAGAVTTDEDLAADWGEPDDD